MRPFTSSVESCQRSAPPARSVNPTRERSPTRRFETWAKTASVHVTNILHKLGASSRVQAATIAERARLLDG